MLHLAWGSGGIPMQTLVTDSISTVYYLLSTDVKIGHLLTERNGGSTRCSVVHF